MSLTCQAPALGTARASVFTHVMKLVDLKVCMKIVGLTSLDLKEHTHKKLNTTRQMVIWFVRREGF